MVSRIGLIRFFVGSGSTRIQSVVAWNRIFGEKMVQLSGEILNNFLKVVRVDRGPFNSRAIYSFL